MIADKCFISYLNAYGRSFCYVKDDVKLNIKGILSPLKAKKNMYIQSVGEVDESYYQFYGVPTSPALKRGGFISYDDEQYLICTTERVFLGSHEFYHSALLRRCIG